MIPLVVASERGRAQTCYVAMHNGGCRTTPWYSDHEQNVLESSTKEDESSVCEVRRGLVVS